MKRMSLFLATLLGVVACGSGEPGASPRADGPVAVTVSRERRAPTTRTYPAVVEAEQTADVATRMSGTVVEVMVDLGQRVTSGQTLFVVDAEDVAARVAAASSQLDLARRTFERIDNLAEDGAASRQELDQARAVFEAARAATAEARAQEAYAVVRAPFTGVVTARALDPGDLAAPGRPVLSIESTAGVKVVAELPADRVGSLSEGDAVEVTIPGKGDGFHARVTRVATALDPSSRTFRVEASPVGGWPGVASGSYARLVLGSVDDGPRWLPADAVVRRGQLRGVYAVEGDTLRLRWVRLGQTRGGAVELLAGPATSLTVVRDPEPELFDGLAVARADVVEWDGPAPLEPGDEPAPREPGDASGMGAGTDGPAAPGGESNR